MADPPSSLKIGPLEDPDDWREAVMCTSTTHPWRPLLDIRTPELQYSRWYPRQSVFLYPLREGIAKSEFECSLEINPPPVVYTDASRHDSYGKYRGRFSPLFVEDADEVHESVILKDVENFRTKIANKIMRGWRTLRVADSSDVHDPDLDVHIDPRRPVIYRYIDVVKGSFAILEAIHFELFMPDRLDLRFLCVRISSVPPDTVRGDYFHIYDLSLLLSAYTFTVSLHPLTYPVVWEATEIRKLSYPSNGKFTRYALTMKTQDTRGGVNVIVDGISSKIFIADSLYPVEESLEEGRMVIVAFKKTSSAQIYPVEPPRSEPKREKEKERNGEWNECAWKKKSYLYQIRDVRTSSQLSGTIVTGCRSLTRAETEMIEDRLGDFNASGSAVSIDLMEELFRLGCRFREIISRDVKDAGDMRIHESDVLKRLGKWHESTKESDALSWIYGFEERSVSLEGTEMAVPYEDEEDFLRLNQEQSCAVRWYSDRDGPRVFCILAPPGSGKTTVAAAMAAEVSRSDWMEKLGFQQTLEKSDTADVQLLLAVQNVAVDNIGAALKKMHYSGREVYNMKTNICLDPENPAPFDFFDLMDEHELKRWKARKAMVGSSPSEKHNYDKSLTTDRNAFEKKMEPTIFLSTVEMVLRKMCLDCYLTQFLGRTNRIIIDEASLLTEAALFAIMRTFPQARIVLIGDEKQLPPFMYDKTVLGHELAGRPALSVAMKTGKVPVVQLREVYRAPPSIMAPYNRLAYGGILVSRKSEGAFPLSEIGLIHSGVPQLLLIDVDGKQERNQRNQSLSNKKEIDALIRVLKRFPMCWFKDTMIICLYKEQKKRMQEALDGKFPRSRLEKRSMLTVLTVDSSQGKEASIVIVASTRTDLGTIGSSGFFYSKERCNVAISRQQKALIILGKASLLSTNAPWSTIVNGDDFTKIREDQV